MKKFVKKYALKTSVMSILWILYGAILNFILQGENASVLLSCIEGILVGVFTGIIYAILTFSFGYCFNQKDFDDRHAKRLIIFMNLVVCILTSYGITILIGNNKWTTFTYAWMYIVNFLFSGLVIIKANYDGKKLRQALSEKQ